MKIDVSHIAKLANLPLSKQEEEKFAKQLEETLTYIDKLKEVPTAQIPPTNNITGLENVLRSDTTTPSLPQEEVLRNAKQTHNGFFTVKAILK